jgi:nitrite reductase/ring-hydroxylating ferredoxin subunit
MSDRDEKQERPAGIRPSLVDVGSADQLPPGNSMRVAVGDAEFTLVNTGEAVLAVGDLCLRCSSSLSAAAVRGPLLTCLHCGWQYDLVRACVVGLPLLRIDRQEVRVDHGHLFVVASVDAPQPVS